MVARILEAPRHGISQLAAKMPKILGLCRSQTRARDLLIPYLVMNCIDLDIETTAYPRIGDLQDLATVVDNGAADHVATQVESAPPTLAEDEDELPTMIAGGDPPSLIQVPAWPPQSPALGTGAASPRGAEAWRKPHRGRPLTATACVPVPTFVERRPEAVASSARGGSSVLESRTIWVAAYAFLGMSAAWASFAVTSLF